MLNGPTWMDNLLPNAFSESLRDCHLLMKYFIKNLWDSHHSYGFSITISRLAIYRSDFNQESWTDSYHPASPSSFPFNHELLTEFFSFYSYRLSSLLYPPPIEAIITNLTTLITPRQSIITNFTRLITPLQSITTKLTSL